MTEYFQPVLQLGGPKPAGAIRFGDSGFWFASAVRLTRDAAALRVNASEVPKPVLERLTQKRADICGLDMASPKLMGVLNVTPDSFSDGGDHAQTGTAVARGLEMARNGADIIDVGGESTRPGADFVGNDAESQRVLPVIKGLRDEGLRAPISIDTRKADVAQASLDAGAALFNDVTALSFDPDSIRTAAASGATVCLMHASGDPKTMQDNPSYENVVLDVYDYLSTRVDLCVAAGIPREKIIVDPGIGFGKTVVHNLALLRHLSLFHTLGCVVLLGVSRKRFIGTISNTPEAKDRQFGSVAVAQFGWSQGVQIIRAHDIRAHAQAYALWHAINLGDQSFDT